MLVRSYYLDRETYQDGRTNWKWQGYHYFACGLHFDRIFNTKDTQECILDVYDSDELGSVRLDVVRDGDYRIDLKINDVELDDYFSCLYDELSQYLDNINSDTCTLWLKVR